MQLGTEGDMDNILKKIYQENSTNNFDCVDNCVCVNGRIRYNLPMAGNPEPQVSYANLVFGVIRKQ